MRRSWSLKSISLAVVLHGSVVALFVLFLSWNAGYFDAHQWGQPSRSTPVGSSGVIPVAPVLRPADPAVAALYDAWQSGSLLCVRGFYAQPVWPVGRRRSSG